MLGELGGYGGGNLSVLMVDDLEHLEGGEPVDVLGCWVAGFGGEGGEIRSEGVLHGCFMMAQARPRRNVGVGSEFQAGNVFNTQP